MNLKISVYSIDCFHLILEVIFTSKSCLYSAHIGKDHSQIVIVNTLSRAVDRACTTRTHSIQIAFSKHYADRSVCEVLIGSYLCSHGTCVHRVRQSWSPYFTRLWCRTSCHIVLLAAAFIRFLLDFTQPLLDFCPCVFYGDKSVLAYFYQICVQNTPNAYWLAGLPQCGWCGNGWFMIQFPVETVTW